MEIANVRLRLTKVGSDVPIPDATPAEAQLLHMLHQGYNGGLTFGDDRKHIVVIGEAMVEDNLPDKVEPDKTIAAVGTLGQPGFVAAKVEKGKVLSWKKGLRARTDVEEYARLAKKYNGARDKNNKPIIESVWPDKFNPKLPQTFADVPWAQATGIDTAAVNYATGGLKTAGL